MKEIKKVVIAFNEVQENAGPDELDIFDQVELAENCLKELGYETSRVTVNLDLSKFKKALLDEKPDLIFNLVESINNHGELLYFAPALYNNLRIPYTGVNTNGLFITTNKPLAKVWMQRNNIPTPESAELNETHKLKKDKTYLVKPKLEDGSLGFDDDLVFKGADVDKFDKIKVKVKPNYNSIKTKYKNDVPVIVAHLMQQNENSILRKLEKGEYNYTSGDKKFVLTKEDIIVEKDVPKEFVESEFKNGSVYINLTRTKELDAEGYARDIMRRVQALRKKAGLEKKDFIRLCISIDTELTEMIEPFEKELQEKCGVKELYLGEYSGQEKKEFQFKESEKVKGKLIEISLERV